MATVLAADLGGTSTKAALVSSDGEILAEALVPAPAPGISGLILPLDWWNGFREVAGELKAEKESSSPPLRAIAITGVTRTPVILDELGNSACRCDRGSAMRAQQEIVARSESRSRLLRRESAHYDAFHPAARLMDPEELSARADPCEIRRRPEGLRRGATHRAHCERSDLHDAPRGGGQHQRRASAALPPRPARRNRAGPPSARHDHRPHALQPAGAVRGARRQAGGG